MKIYYIFRSYTCRYRDSDIRVHVNFRSYFRSALYTSAVKIHHAIRSLVSFIRNRPYIALYRNVIRKERERDRKREREKSISRYIVIQLYFILASPFYSRAFIKFIIAFKCSLINVSSERIYFPAGQTRNLYIHYPFVLLL